MARVIDLRVKRIRQEAADVNLMLRLTKEQRLGKPVSRLMPPIEPKDVLPLLGYRLDEIQELGGVRFNNPWAERGIEVQGSSERESKTITLAVKDSLPEQRLTLAHEIGHLLLHSSAVHHRERMIRSNGASSISKPRIEDGRSKQEEFEADLFSREVLMPVELTREAALLRFGAPIDTTLAHDELALWLSRGTRRKLEPRNLARLPQIERAKLIASADSFGGGPFEPLCNLFVVPLEAMAFRLIELELAW